MTPYDFAVWHIELLSFNLADRLKSQHATVRQSAQEHSAEREIWRRIRDARPDQWNAVERIYHAWMLDVLPTYNRNPRVYEAENTAHRRDVLQRRNAALAGLGRIAA